MSKYTANEVDAMAWSVENCGLPFHKTVSMLRELASRLLQEEEENRRDPVTDPRPGDMLRVTDGLTVVWVGHVEKTGHTPCADPALWLEASAIEGATIIRRREPSK